MDAVGADSPEVLQLVAVDQGLLVGLYARRPLDLLLDVGDVVVGQHIEHEGLLLMVSTEMPKESISSSELYPEPPPPSIRMRSSTEDRSLMLKLRTVRLTLLITWPPHTMTWFSCGIRNLSCSLSLNWLIVVSL